MSAKTLKFVASMHEQRECKEKVLPLKGAWLEVGKFTHITEQFDIRERWKCEDIRQEGESLVFSLKLLDHEAQRRRAEALAERILEKHGEVLTDSLLWCVIEGAYQRRDDIKTSYDVERFKARVNFHGNREGFTLWEQMEDCKAGIEREKARVLKASEALKDYEEDLRKLEAKNEGSVDKGLVGVAPVGQGV